MSRQITGQLCKFGVFHPNHECDCPRCWECGGPDPRPDRARFEAALDDLTRKARVAEFHRDASPDTKRIAEKSYTEARAALLKLVFPSEDQ